MEAQRNYVTCQDFTAENSKGGHECGSSDVTSTGLSGDHASSPMVAVTLHILLYLAIHLNKIHITLFAKKKKATTVIIREGEGAEPP